LYGLEVGYFEEDPYSDFGLEYDSSFNSDLGDPPDFDNGSAGDNHSSGNNDDCVTNSVTHENSLFGTIQITTRGSAIVTTRVDFVEDTLKCTCQGVTRPVTRIDTLVKNSFRLELECHTVSPNEPIYSGPQNNPSTAKTDYVLESHWATEWRVDYDSSAYSNHHTIFSNATLNPYGIACHECPGGIDSVMPGTFKPR
jgi:hypothetical protein